MSDLIRIDPPEDDDFTEGCLAVYLGSIPYACTRDAGHEGPHIAETAPGRVVATWTD